MAKEVFPYKNGICSVDTLERVFAALDPDHFEKCFLNWINRTSKLTDGEVVAIDGKCLRGSYDRIIDKKAKHVIAFLITGSENLRKLY